MKKNFGMEWRFNLEELAVYRDQTEQARRVAYYREIPVRGGLTGKMVLLAKRVIRKCVRFLVEPVIDDQQKFNAAAANGMAALYKQGIIIQGVIDYMEQKNVANDLQFIEQQQTNAKLFTEQQQTNTKLFAEQQQEILELKQELLEANQRYEKLYREIDMSHIRFLRAVRQEKGETEAEAVIKKLADTDKKENDNSDDVYDRVDYFKFENHFRGSRQQIKESQQIYLKYFMDKKNIVDIGCGRGEFLELLQENSIQCTGIDLYNDYVDFCRMRGLNALTGDAVEYINSLADESIDGLFAAQLAEHLSTSQLVRLCNTAYRKLETNSYFVMETPNPRSLSVYANAFYLDPSHQKPVHPMFLQYLLEEAGFKEVRLLFTESSRINSTVVDIKGSGISNLAEFNHGMAELRELLFSSQDYAVIAKK